MIKVYYEPSFYGYIILAKGMHPLSNSHVSELAHNLDNFKDEVKRRFGTDDIEFIAGLNNYFKDKTEN